MSQTREQVSDKGAIELSHSLTKKHLVCLGTHTHTQKKRKTNGFIMNCEEKMEGWVQGCERRERETAPAISLSFSLVKEIRSHERFSWKRKLLLQDSGSVSNTHTYLFQNQYIIEALNDRLTWGGDLYSTMQTMRQRPGHTQIRVFMSVLMTWCETGASDNIRFQSARNEFRVCTAEKRDESSSNKPVLHPCPLFVFCLNAMSYSHFPQSSQPSMMTPARSDTSPAPSRCDPTTS